MSPLEHRACLLLGSNIKPEKYIPLAVGLLQRQVTIIQASSVWETASVGFSGPNFLNAAILVLTALDASKLKTEVLTSLERRLGRVRTANKNAPRTIDIDIVMFDGQILDSTLWQYVHRAVPVAELVPSLQSESGEYLKDAALRLASSTPIKSRREISISLPSH